MGGGAWIWLAVRGALQTKRLTGWRRGARLLGSLFIVVGGMGFFGSAFSALGGLNWLPNSFEWPVGYASGIIRTGNGLYVVPHTAAGRIQIYDSNWKFQRGWPVDAGGGTFKLVPSGEDQFDVITARMQLHYVFNTNGKWISKTEYPPASYDSFHDSGQSFVVPTAPWLWAFTNPFISLAAIMVGMILSSMADPSKRGGNKLKKSKEGQLWESRAE